MHRGDTWLYLVSQQFNRRLSSPLNDHRQEATKGCRGKLQFCNSAIWIRVHCYGRHTARMFEVFAIREDDAISGGDRFLNNNFDRSYLSRYSESLNDRNIDCLCYVCIATGGPNDDHRRPFWIEGHVPSWTVFRTNRWYLSLIFITMDFLNKSLQHWRDENVILLSKMINIVF